MSRTLPFRILNVFVLPAGSALTGNPLCVFEDATGLDTDAMQALTVQMNLSETTFILPSATATARVRIFSPGFEMPFAGHPTLGTAHVVRALLGTGAQLSLEMLAGTIPVSVADDGCTWSLGAVAPRWRAAAPRAALAEMLRLSPSDVAGDALWVDAGSEQLVIPLASADAVWRAQPTLEALIAHGSNERRQGLAYVFARTDADGILSRFFFNKRGSVIEDPGTGSAAANLGGYLLATGHTGPLTLSIDQGEATGRPCRLGLRLDAEGRVFVSGRVVEVARGVFTL